MMFYSWFSLNSFNAWHDAVKFALDIPRPGRNAATGEIDETAQWTTAYTEPIIVSENDVRAFVEDHVAALIPEGLGVPSQEPDAGLSSILKEVTKDGH